MSTERRQRPIVDLDDERWNVDGWFDNRPYWLWLTLDGYEEIEDPMECYPCYVTYAIGSALSAIRENWTGSAEGLEQILMEKTVGDVLNRTCKRNFLRGLDNWRLKN